MAFADPLEPWRRYTEKMQRDLRRASQAATSMELIREISEQLNRTYDISRFQAPVVWDTQLIERLSRQITARHEEVFREVAARLTQTENLKRVSEQLAIPYSSDYFRRVSEQLARAAQAPAWQRWTDQISDASRVFEEAAAEDAPTEGPSVANGSHGSHYRFRWRFCARVFRS